MFFVYVLKSLKDNKRYIGSTNDFSRRFQQHTDGKVRSTKSRRPFEVQYTEEYDNESQARLREYYFKTHKGFIELNKIIKDLK